jgi:hypothetical protein
VSEAAAAGGGTGGTGPSASGGSPGGAQAGNPATSPSGSAPQTAANPGAAPGATPAVPPPAEPRKYKVRVSGKEVEVTRESLLDDLEREIGEDGILDLHKLRKGSYERFEKAKKAQSVVDQYENLLKNPQQVFAELARRHGPDQAAKMIEDQYKRIDTYRKMTPQQRQDFEQRQQYENDKRMVASEKARIEAVQKHEKVQKDVVRVRAAFDKALQEVGIPVNNASIARMAIIAKEAGKAGIPMTYADAAKQVQTEVRQELQSILKALKPEQVREYLGDEHIALIRKMEMDRLDKPGPTIAQPRSGNGQFVPVRGQVNGQPPEKQRIPMRQWLAQERLKR